VKGRETRAEITEDPSEELGHGADDRIGADVLRSVSSRPWLLALASGIVSGAVYIATLRPTVASPRDAAELALAAMTTGVPHPTGYPLYMLLGRGWIEILPFGEAGWRLNLFSALCTAVAIAFLTRLLLRIVSNTSAAIFAAMVFAFSPIVWADSTAAEVYPLHLLFQVAILLIWRTWEDTREFRLLALLAVTIGFSFTHHLMTALTLSCICVAALISWSRWWSARNAVVLVALLILPLSLYAYIPIVVSFDPQIEWLDLSTPALIFEHVTGGAYKRVPVSPFDGIFYSNLVRYPAGLIRQFLWLALLIPVGMYAWRRNKGLFFPVLVDYLVSTYFALTYPVVDPDSFYLGSCLFAALFIAAGADWLIAFVRNAAPALATTASVAVLIFPVVQLLANFSEQNRTAEYTVYDRDMAALALAPPDSILLTWGDANFPLYASLAHGVRPDVEVLNLHLAIRGDYDSALEEIRRRRDIESDDRIRATLEVMQRLGGRTRALVALPVAAGSGWDEFGLHVIERGGILEIVRDPPDIGVPTAAAAEGSLFRNGLELLGVRVAAEDVRNGDIVEVDYTWRVSGAKWEELRTVTVFADAEGQAPTDAEGRVRFEESHSLGLGTDLDLLSPSEAFRERVAIQVPHELSPGSWTLWVGLRDEFDSVPRIDGSSLAAEATLNVREGARELWALPRIHRFE
jgi:hypothetical protein